MAPFVTTRDAPLVAISQPVPNVAHELSMRQAVLLIFPTTTHALCTMAPTSSMSVNINALLDALLAVAPVVEL